MASNSKPADDYSLLRNQISALGGVQANTSPTWMEPTDPLAQSATARQLVEDVRAIKSGSPTLNECLEESKELRAANVALTNQLMESNRKLMELADRFARLAEMKHDV